MYGIGSSSASFGANSAVTSKNGGNGWVPANMVDSCLFAGAGGSCERSGDRRKLLAQLDLVRVTNRRLRHGQNADPTATTPAWNSQLRFAQRPITGLSPVASSSTLTDVDGNSRSSTGAIPGADESAVVSAVGD